MPIDLRDRVRVAYKKLKQMVYFEKYPLTLRRRLAEFECDNRLDDRLDIVRKVAESNDPYKTAQFKVWLDDIRFDVIPKNVELADKLPENQGSFVTNVTSADHHLIKKVNYMFDGPIELHLLSVLWLMIEGPAYDNTLSEHCSGSRLHPFVGDDNDNSAYLFKKYHELYAKWRDSGIRKARHLLSKDQQSVCIVGLDLQEYYYRIRLNWDELRNQIKRPKPEGVFENFFMERETLGASLFKCVKHICQTYRKKLTPLLEITHPELTSLDTCLPIGLSASPVIANWYLKDFDDAILKHVRPAYYGRYIDDILMVVPVSTAPKASDPIMSFMDQILVSAGILKWDGENERFEFRSKPGLILQKKKCILQFFDSEHSIAGLDKFQKQLEQNASDFALLPVDGEESPVAQVAYDLLYEGSVNKFRSVKAIAENRWELARHLSKQTQLYLMTEGTIDQQMKDELFRFFKGRNAIDYCDMWERVICFFVIAGDIDSADQFEKAIDTEIEKIRYNSSTHQRNNDSFVVSDCLREALTAHLARCMELCLAVLGSHVKQLDASTQLWRKSNLIRHHLVAIPLLNYTSFEGNLASPIGPSSVVIDHQKAVSTPRFVHFDECLGFVGSGCAKLRVMDSVTRANEIYTQFHGLKHPDAICSQICEEESK